MIVILSKSFDKSTDVVEQWLGYYGAILLRINLDEIYENKNDELDKVCYLLNNNIHFNLWIRTDNAKSKKRFFDTHNGIHGSMFLEFNHSYIKLLFYKAKKVLGCSSDNITNFSKLKTLELAKEVGLTIPATEFINTKIQLESFIKTHGAAITKPFSDVFKIEKGKIIYKSLTTCLSSNCIKTLPANFGLSLIQCKIDKVFDLKITYLDGELFPALIVTRNKNHNAIDYRDYQSSNIRMTSYKISSQIATQIRQLMKNLEINFGVIDFVVDNQNKLFFLEVNPYGIFQDASFYCNYPIENKIARWLMN